MTKKKRVWKILAIAAGLLILWGILAVINGLTGYPVDYFVVRHAARAYVAEQYPDRALVVESPERTLKLGGFQVWVTDPNSPDSAFQLHFETDGTLRYDSYQQDVAQGFNTLTRLSREYGQMCQAALGRKAFPYEAQCSGSFDDALTGNKAGEPGTLPLPLDGSRLEPDSHPELNTLSPDHGVLYLEVRCEKRTVDTAAQCLLAIRSVMEDCGLPFRCVDLDLVSPEADDPIAPEDHLHILNFGWEDIYQDGLTDRVQAALEATQEYYGR